MKYFFDFKKEFFSEIGNRRGVVFLDYDGTLTPIVDTPDQAILKDNTRIVVSELSTLYEVAIVSGRATDDVRSKVNLEGVFYAGSHGFEILLPDGKKFIQPDVQAMLPSIDRVFSQMHEALAGIKGALVEHVKYTVSCHYRLVDEEKLVEFKAILDKVLLGYPDLKVTHGKKVYEIRPRVDWHKGKAVKWISDMLNVDPQSHAVIYIGDDTTDEDAFEEVQAYGLGLGVMEKPRESKARYFLKDPSEVAKFLKILIEKSLERKMV